MEKGNQQQSIRKVYNVKYINFLINVQRLSKAHQVQMEASRVHSSEWKRGLSLIRIKI